MEKMTIRWGVIGTGGIASRFAEAMQLVPDGVIAAVGSRSSETAEAFAQRHGIGQSYGSYAAVAEAPDIDVVYVAMPHPSHHADAILCMERGKNVLCETPMATNSSDVREMVACARKNGVFLMETIWSRFLPSYRILTDLIGEGRIGAPLLVEADFGFRAPVNAEHRLFNRKLGGGAVLRHRQGQLGVIKAAITLNMSCRARITGESGWIDLSPPMHCATRVSVGGPAGAEHHDAAYEGDGLRFKIAEVNRCVSNGLVESRTMPLDESVQLASSLSSARRR